MTQKYTQWAGCAFCLDIDIGSTTRCTRLPPACLDIDVWLRIQCLTRDRCPFCRGELLPHSSHQISNDPPGYYDDFCDCLKTGSSLFLVCEVDGRILGVGGISMNQGENNCASLCYGLIHPAHHKEGFGTVMLLARLALLPVPDGRWFTFMLTVKGSATFYQRFGFSGELMVDDRNNEMWQYSTLIDPGCLQQCREALAAASITIDTKGVMIPPIAVRTPEPPAEAAPPA